MQVYFRVCEKQQSLSNVQRLGDLPKSLILKKCWLSLQNSVNEKDGIIIVNDNLSKETLDFLTNSAKTKNIVVENIPAHGPDDHQQMIGLIRILLSNTKSAPNDIHYLVEDDYLHVPHALEFLKSLYIDTKWTHCAVTQDYPDRYTLDINRNCQVIMGKYCHWRTIPSATFNIAALGEVWNHHAKLLETYAPHNDDRHLPYIFNTNPCVSPLPGLSAHLTPYHISPYVDWNTVWESIQV